jgi:hypothetical protein
MKMAQLSQPFFKSLAGCTVNPAAADPNHPKGIPVIPLSFVSGYFQKFAL